MPIQAITERPDPVARLLAGYQTMEGVPDELKAADGQHRPAWTNLIGAIASMSATELAERFAYGDQYLRDAGVFYRRYGAQDSAERDWPLSHMPVLIAEKEWAEISAGLIERADLLEKVVADIHGENQLVADGYLPAELVAGNPEWLRPLVGVKPRSGHFLHFVAFDIGRGPKGQWWVIGDRTQAPSGAGFALENRIATARIYSEHFARSNVHRLAGFFRAFRDRLQDMREGVDSRVGILTPGPMNDTYFEHAYIARYLGFMLLEGEDLTMRNGHLMVRTVAGLKPVNVLWRRLDASWADPLELNENSKLGTAGLLGAVREGNLTMVNALGSGVLESRALLAFLPRISTALTGRPLAIPNVATWWCGQEDERDFVKANAHRMAIGDAFSTRPLFEFDDGSIVGGNFKGEQGQTLDNWIDERASHLVGQEAVTLSTTPTFQDGVLVPRPMGMRLFLARTENGWQVMPGGFARIGRADSATALALQGGGSTADVWIVSDKPVAPDSMMGPATAPYSRQQPAVLPSRAGDNLFWLGRYVERAEFAIRLLRAYNLRLAESASPDSPLLALVAEELDKLGSEPTDGLPQGIAMMLASAATAAGHVRDRFSVDGWLALHDLSKTVNQMTRTAKPGDDMARAMGVLLRKLSGFSGLVHENMYHFTGWRFLSIGRALERAVALAGMLASFADPKAPDGSLDLAVEVADSSMSHRTRFAVSTTRATVIDLLALDQLNPRSIMYQLNEMNAHISFLPEVDRDGPLSQLQKLMMQTHTKLAVQTPETLGTRSLLDIRQDFFALSNQLSATYLA
jgi:uncharacterized circularly permuted ATP-grasp superfamily protein/uncharacterized alpha-E superfamily protein